ncbi:MULTISPECIES: KxYKxGKxW signal peptide domain-containing protein [unclassified Adlercreutzia]
MNDAGKRWLFSCMAHFTY